MPSGSTASHWEVNRPRVKEALGIALMRCVWGETVAPAGQRTRKRKRYGFVHGAGDRPGEDVGRNGSELGQVGNRIGEGAGTGRRGEHHVAIEWRMSRPDCAGETILGHDRKPLRLWLG